MAARDTKDIRLSPDSSSRHTGAGGLHSTARDLLRWDRALAAGRGLPDAVPLFPSMRRLVVSRPTWWPRRPPAGIRPGPVFYPHSGTILLCRCLLMSVVPGLTLPNSVAASEGQGTERSRQGRDVGLDAVLPVQFAVSFKPPGVVPGGGGGQARAVVPPGTSSGGTVMLRPVRIVVRAADPEVVQHHRELARHGDRCPLARVLSTPCGDPLSVPP